ncbi:unnamed protein product [Calypogeia fissa]
MSISSPPSCLSSSSSAPKCQFGSLNRQYSSCGDCLSARSRYVLPLPFQRGIRQTGSIKQHRYSTICAAAPDLAAGAKNTKLAPLTIKDAKIVAEPPKDNQLKIRVDIDGQATKRAFDTVLKDLAKNAPPVPGFRKAKGGKTSIVPLNVIYQLMGPRLVRKFVIEEILKATLNDYVQKEGIKVKNELKTDQSSDELDAQFEPGKEFGFNATLDLAEEETPSNENTAAEAETETQAQTLEASV